MEIYEQLLAERAERTKPRTPAARPAFGGEIDNGTLYGTPPWAPVTSRIARRDAIRVPAVKKTRDLIANAVGGLALQLQGPSGLPVAWPLFEQPEAGIAPAITWTNVAEDLLFEKIAWLYVTKVGWHGYPTQVVRLDPATVTVQPDMRVFQTAIGGGTATIWPEDTRLIRIESPNDALLVAGANAIRLCIALAEFTGKTADGLPPLALLTPADSAPPLDDDAEIDELLKSLQEQKGPVRYIDACLKLLALGWNPEQLQLTEMRNQAVLEIARLGGIDPEELGVSTTSRTYFNAFDRRWNFIEFTIKGYLSAITGALSLPAVTPRGFKVAHNLDAFFKVDTLSRYQAYEVGERVGAITLDEIREAEDKPPLTPEQRAEIHAARRATPPPVVPSADRPKEIEA